MKPFLQEVAENVSKKYAEKANKICLIFPNKRAGVFFRRYYAEIQNKTTFPPQIFDIAAFIKSITKLNKPDNLSLIFDLYRIFKQLNVNEFENNTYTFDKFFHLGEILLRDFSLIDSYLVDAESLFKNIADIQEIETLYDYFTEEQKDALRNFWQSFTLEKQSDEKRKFLTLWNKLPLVYKSFSEQLLMANQAYEGLMFKFLASKLDANQVQFYYEKYIFIGFNSLNKAEIKLFKLLNNENKAEFYWDTDSYYINDTRQEAGYFLRNNLKIFADDTNLHIPSNMLIDKTITLLGVPLEVGQAKAINKILSSKEYNTETAENLHETAVILADEHLLFPVLHSIPAHIQDINITMGYPFTQTPLYGLLQRYLNIQRFAANMKDDSRCFYHTDVLGLLRHPDVRFRNEELADKYIDDIQTNNRVYIGTSYFEEAKNPLFSLLFTKIGSDDGKLLFVNVLELVYLLYSNRHFAQEEFEADVEDEYLYEAYKHINRLHDIIVEKGENMNIQTAVKLFIQYLSSVSIPFSGEALTGLQVMGVMETRNIDFKNVIILGVNEGTWAAVNRPPTFISENLRWAFGLPTIQYQSAIAAYHFYRLIQRANNITIMYNSITGYNGAGELSRYVQQLIFESGLNMKHLQFKHFMQPTQKNFIEIAKNEDIQKKLSQYVAIKGVNGKSLSASALNTFLDCSLKFYFNYIAGIKQAETVTEDIDALMFGNLLHYTIEKLYKELILHKEARIVEIQDFKWLFQNIEKSIESAFKTEFENDDNFSKEHFTFQGSQLIIKEVIKKHVTHILNVDKTYAPFRLVALESKDGYKGTVKSFIDGKDVDIRVNAIIDRIDEKDGLFRLVDYKTGSAEKSFNKLEDAFNPDISNRKKIVLQMFLYGYIFKQVEKKPILNVAPAVYNLREMHNENFDPYLSIKIDKTKEIVSGKLFDSLIPEFEELMSLTISQLFNQNIPFSQTENSAVCEYCPYSLICEK